MYCMSVASTIAKLPFSTSTVTLRYGEDDIYLLLGTIVVYIISGLPKKDEIVKPLETLKI